MPDRVGIFSEDSVRADGRVVMILPGHVREFVDPALDDEELARRHDLDEIVRFCTAIHLDGPLAGTTTGYVVRRLGWRYQFLVPTAGTYELVKLPEGGEPGELRLVEPDDQVR